jgi:hypothetical protein
MDRQGMRDLGDAGVGLVFAGTVLARRRLSSIVATTIDRQSTDREPQATAPLGEQIATGRSILACFGLKGWVMFV